MKHASVAELKARLSEYLAAARLGEDIIVTDRGRPVARLCGLQGDAKLTARVAEMIRIGLMRPPRGNLPADFWDEERVADPGGRALVAILAEREEGR